MPKITQKDREMLYSPITLEEVKIAIKQMKLNKCPGLDGLNVEFYKKFETELLPSLHSVILKAVSNNKFHMTANQGILSLIDKPDKDLLSILNWRPLTMLNCDYKIYSKIIANRLQMVLPLLLHNDQKGFVKGRKISRNILELQSIIEYCNLQDIDAFIMVVDFEKAFDKVEWPPFFEVLKRYGFGSQFIKYI